MAVCAGEPSASGLQENDYPVLSDDRIGLAALREIGSVKRLPLPAELAERFACILCWQQQQQQQRFCIIIQYTL